MSLYNDNVAYCEDTRTELLDGKIVAMATPDANHNTIVLNIALIFKAYLQGKPCQVYGDNMAVHFTKKDICIPDVTVVCNKDIIKLRGIYGAPDLVVEVLSPSTAKRDKGYKMDLYSRNGVREYWIVDTKSRSIEVYLQQGNRLTLDNVYTLLSSEYTDGITEEELAEIPSELKTSLFDDLIIKLEDVFVDMI
ncbi:MAG: Uma2 family endonuclease [Defluviitaleaceae bacterium]|nr:Uma2 family endonuclease [Defluviitaleaceae bacterium]